MKYLFTCITLFWVGTLHAQNYQTVQNGTQQFFEKSNNQLFGVGVESAILSNSDSIYSLVKTYQDDMFDGYCTDTASWLGLKIQLSPNGDNVFYNTDNESITIKTTANLNDTWTLYTFSNGNYVEATLTAITHDIIVGSVMDSVKTITLQTKNSQGNNITHLVNNKTLKFSKNYGLIKTLKLFEFPTNLADDYTFVDNSNQIGNYKLTPTMAYDYQIGDIFQYRKLTGDNHYHKEYTYTQYTVLNRTDGATTRTYTMARSRYEEVFDDSDFDQIFDVHEITYYPKDTIVQTVDLVVESNAMEMDKLPYEIYGPRKFLVYYLFPNSYNNRIIHENKTYQYSTSWDSCFSVMNDWGDEYERSEKYVKGLGKVYDGYYTMTNGIDAYYNFEALIYYEKGVETWGAMNANLPITDSLLIIQESDYSLVRENMDVYFSNLTNRTYHEILSNDRTVTDYWSTYIIEEKSELTENGFCKTNGGFIANKIIVTPSKLTYLLNLNGDSILIKTEASVNDTWKVMDLDNGAYVEAKVTNIDNNVAIVNNFSNNTYDDVKTIVFNAKDVNGNAMNHIINGKSIETSKKHGLYKGVSFLNFPLDTANYKLTGFDDGNGLKGYDNYTNIDNYKLIVYPGHVGSEFHYKEVIEENNTRIIYLTRKEITNVTIVPLEYDLLICEATITETDNDGDGIYEQSDSSVITSSTILNYVPSPELSTVNRHFEKIGNEVFYHIDYQILGLSYRIDSLSFNNNNCWVDSDNCWERKRYQTYTSWFGKRLDINENINTCTGEKYIHNYELVYYRKGTLEYGTPALSCNFFITNNENQIAETPNVTVFPNPTDEILNFKITENGKSGQVRIFNMVGQMVFEQDFYADFNINTSTWQNGVYMVEMTIGESRKVEKILVQH